MFVSFLTDSSKAEIVTLPPKAEIVTLPLVDRVGKLECEVLVLSLRIKAIERHGQFVFEDYVRSGDVQPAGALDELGMSVWRLAKGVAQREVQNVEMRKSPKCRAVFGMVSLPTSQYVRRLSSGDYICRFEMTATEDGKKVDFGQRVYQDVKVYINIGGTPYAIPIDPISSEW